MAKWYDPWLSKQERSQLQVGQKGIRARQRMKDMDQKNGTKFSAPAKQVDTVPGTSTMTNEERNRKRLRNNFNKR